MVAILNTDRILIVAPHPDDESLGAGGLLQRAFAAGIPVKIVFATNGDNNPWAQRYWERRWKMGVNERQRWGERRQQEALKAIEVLGGSPNCARFLDLPDQGVTDLLMTANRDLWERLKLEIFQWKPTLLVIPSLMDSHPDHSALCVLLSRLAQMMGPVRIMEYLIHKPSVQVARQPTVLQLTTEEIEIKRRAIFCHKTQVELSGKRFTRFAAAEESYYHHNAVGIPADDKPFQSVRFHDGILDLRLSTFRRDQFNAVLLISFQSPDGDERRWKLPLPPLSGAVPVIDAVTGRSLPDGHIRRSRGTLRVEIPFSELPGRGGIFVKLSAWALFFDRSGWFQVVLPVESPKHVAEHDPAHEVVPSRSTLANTLSSKS